MKHFLLNRILSEKLGLLTLVLLAGAGRAGAQPTVLGSNVANAGGAGGGSYGTYMTYDLEERGTFRRKRLQEGRNANSAIGEWQFTQGTAASPDYTKKWMPYNGGLIIAGFNQFIAPLNSVGSPAEATATYSGSGGSPGKLPALTLGTYYTFNVGKNAATGGTGNNLGVLATTYNPVTISSIAPSGTTNPVAYGAAYTVTATLSGTPNAAEYFYLRYTTNNYTTSTLLPMTVSGTTATATIPNQTSTSTTNPTVQYYVLSSPNPATATGPAQVDNTNADMLTLERSGTTTADFDNSFTYVATTLSSTAQSPAAGAVPYADAVTVTLNLGGVPSPDEYFYLVYSADGFATKTAIAPTTQSGPTATFTVPNLTSTSNTNPTVSYYLVSSPATTAATEISSGYSYRRLLNNGGSNYTYSYVATTLSSAAQSPADGSVSYGSPVTVTLNLGGTPSPGEYLYLIYSADGFATKTVLAPTTQSGSTATFTLPNLTSTSNTNPTVRYYLASSPATTAAAETSASYPYRRLLNNGGSNYGYTYNATSLVSTSQSPAAGAVVYGNDVTVTLNLGGTPSANEYFYLVYSTNNFASKTAVAPASQSGATVTFVLPNQTSAAKYYLLSSPAATDASEASSGYSYISLLNNSGGNYGYAVGPLPVKLVRFEATRKATSAELKWNTASEQNNKGFEVQVSTDGRSFRVLHFTASGAANATSPREYAYTDFESGKTGLRYYRLRQLDFDGTATFSPIRTVDFDQLSATSLSVAPNPFSTQLTLTGYVATATEDALLTITDASGRTLREEPLALAAGTSTITLTNLNGLPAGLYMLHLRVGGQMQHVKVAKQ